MMRIRGPASALAAALMCVAASPLAAAGRPAVDGSLLVAHDFNGDGRSDLAVFDAGHWNIRGLYAKSFGTTGDIATVFSDTGIGVPGVFRPSTGAWYVDYFPKLIKVYWGQAGDIPVPGHYSGISSGENIAIFRPASGVWHVRGRTATAYGESGDIPIPGRWAGSANDYADTIAVFRPSNGTWYRLGLSSVHYGARGDIPVPADYNGNGVTEVALYRTSTQVWHFYGHSPVHYGNPGDIPVTGDFNGDGRADIAVYRPSDRTWHIRGIASIAFGASGDVPIGKAPYRG